MSEALEASLLRSAARRRDRAVVCGSFAFLARRRPVAVARARAGAIAATAIVLLAPLSRADTSSSGAHGSRSGIHVGRTICPNGQDPTPNRVGCWCSTAGPVGSWEAAPLPDDPTCRPTERTDGAYCLWSCGYPAPAATAATGLPKQEVTFAPVPSGDVYVLVDYVQKGDEPAPTKVAVAWGRFRRHGVLSPSPGKRGVVLKLRHREESEPLFVGTDGAVAWGPAQGASPRTAGYALVTW